MTEAMPFPKTDIVLSYDAPSDEGGGAASPRRKERHLIAPEAHIIDGPFV